MCHRRAEFEEPCEELSVCRFLQCASEVDLQSLDKIWSGLKRIGGVESQNRVLQRSRLDWGRASGHARSVPTTEATDWLRSNLLLTRFNSISSAFPTARVAEIRDVEQNELGMERGSKRHGVRHYVPADRLGKSTGNRCPFQLNVAASLQLRDISCTLPTTARREI